MAEPSRQVEVQLGHLCNNRCVFCVSGQLSEQKRAPQLPAEPIQRQLREARENGATKITFLGGEPTMQASFLDLLRFAVSLDFQEIVIFTNGTMTPRASFRRRVFEVLQGLGPQSRERVIWRFSLQGGTREAHDETTVNPGAWDRIIASLDVLKEQGARLTGNLCVVSQNYASIPDLGAVAQHYGFENLHLDMVRPRDSGDRTDEWLLSIMARYTDMAPSFEALEREVVERLGPDFDLNFGNVPYCTMPAVAHRIHHDGQDTVTVAADGQGNTQQGFDKYADKRSDKRKPASCEGCVFDDTCSGVFDKYRQFHGDLEFQAVNPQALWQLDSAGHHFLRLALPTLRTLEPAGLRILRVDERTQEIDVDLLGWRAVLRRPGRRSVRQGWLKVVGERVELVLVGSQIPDSTMDSLVQGVRLLAGLGGQPPRVDPAQVSSAWRREELRLRGEKQRQNQVLRTIAGLVEQLRREPMAGLVPGAPQRSADGLGADMAFTCANGQLRLAIRVEQTAEGIWRPRFRHDAQGLDDTQVSAFNAALAQRLRGLSARPVV
jgi:MoaA/NifB/PqqE/SkfB family radical SAM enzyme